MLFRFCVRPALWSQLVFETAVGVRFSFSQFHPHAWACNFQDWKCEKIRETHFLAKQFAIRFDCVIFAETCYWTICGKEKNEKALRQWTPRTQKSKLVLFFKRQARQFVERQRQFQQLTVATPWSTSNFHHEKLLTSLRSQHGSHLLWQKTL